jgi:nucleoside-diphosphate-sugar epimerase
VSRRIAIVGASGLVGAALVERLLSNGRDGVVALIHSSGNAWRLASQGLPLVAIDLLDRSALTRVLEGCTHVVNCSRGDDRVMILGLRNLLAAAKAAKVKRFVHLSSVAVYGDPPHPLSDNEDAPAVPAKDSYGAIKLRQDTLVAKAAKSGLSALSLCPPNIGGPYSYFCNSLVALLRGGEFALLEDGATCCNVVDVANLALAIELSLGAGADDGRRVFVTDGADVTWRDVISGLAPLAGIDYEQIPVITRDELARHWPPRSAPMSLVRSMKHLLSNDVRRALREDPLLRKVDQTVRDAFALLGSAAENRVRMSLHGSLRPAAVDIAPRLNYQASAQQLRGVRHSCARARQMLGYAPQYSFQQSMAAYAAWYRHHHGLDGAHADLIRQLL